MHAFEPVGLLLLREVYIRGVLVGSRHYNNTKEIKMERHLYQHQHSTFTNVIHDIQQVLVFVLQGEEEGSRARSGEGERD